MQYGSYALAERINREVNEAVGYCSDMELFGRGDFWTVVESLGDCDDYTLTKRARLIRAGFPLYALRIVVVFTETPAGRARLNRRIAGEDFIEGDHAALICSTERGDFLADNRFPHLIPLSLTGYTIDRMQIAGASAWEYGQYLAARLNQ